MQTIDLQELEALRNLKLNIKRTFTYTEGFRRSSAKGRSAEFSGYREYIPGDDMKQLVTSRDLQYHYRDMCTVSISTIADVLQKLGYEFTFVDGIPYWVMYARIE